MNDAQIRSKLKEGISGRYRVDNGLYFRVTPEKSGFWVLRYTMSGKRREITIGRYGRPPEGIPLADAKNQAAEFRASVRQGLDPLAEKKRSPLVHLQTVNDVAKDWLNECERRLKHPNIPARVYRKDISPFIGELSIDRVNARDILAIIRTINESGRPSISNDALGYCKQLFNHAIKLDLISNNPALPFKISDAGGLEKSRDRILSESEIKLAFQAMRENSDQFVRDNYLACILLICLGVRKGELLSATWDEFDLDKAVWNLPAARSKNGIAISYPLHEKLIDIFIELKVRSSNSEFVFPNRRASKRFKHISPDTLNAAVSKLLKNNKMEISHFTIHDFRRTFRTILAKLGVAPHVAERCLNHKLPKIMSIYDQHDYFDERKQAHDAVIDVLKSYLW